MFMHALISWSFATTLLIKAPNANSQEFATYAQNSSTEKISTYFLKCESKKDLYEDFKKAQIQFLDGFIDKAKSFFINVAEKKWTCDWSDDERKIISFSFLRLAQLESNDLSRTRWLQDSLDFDDQLKPDESVFPPPLIKEWTQLQKKQVPQKITLPHFSQKFSALLRNGRFISLAQLTLQAPPGKARYTFISDSFQIEKEFVTLSELEVLSLEPQPLIFGDCENFHVAESLRFLKNVSVFHGLDCIRENKNIEKNFAALSSQEAALGSFTKESEDSKPANTSWIQRNGVWLGTAIVGSLLIGYHLNKQSESQSVAVPSTILHQ